MEKEKIEDEGSYFSSVTTKLSSYDPWKTVEDLESPVELKKKKFEYEDEELDAHEKPESQKKGKEYERYSGKGVRNKINKINM